MQDDRRPLIAKALPALQWKRCGENVLIDTAADDLARFQVYRYCSLPEALQLFGDRAWTLAHPRLWPDKYEHHVSRSLFDGAGPFANVSAYLKCLSLEFGSNALWRMYAGAVGVVRIGIALQDLVVMLDKAVLPARSKIHIARVRYMDERPMLREVNRLLREPPKAGAEAAVQALAMKRSGFAYENELRICLISPRRSDPPPVQVLGGLKVDRIRSLHLDPYLPAWQAEALRVLFETRLGINAKVAQSAFDAEVPVSESFQE